MKKPKFIVVEGIDGSGKTTLIEYLKTILPNTHFLKFPQNPKIKTTNEFLNEMVSYYKKINKNQKNIISDRWCPSTLVYSAKTIEEAKKIINFPYQPNIYIFINTKPKIAMERIKTKNKKNTRDPSSIRQLIILKSKYLKYFRFIKEVHKDIRLYKVNSIWDALEVIYLELER